MTKRNKIRMSFDVKMWREYEPPTGFLNPHPACHALFYYATLMARIIADPPNAYEGDTDSSINAFQLYSSSAVAYGVAPEQLSHFWDNVDSQFAILGFDLIPGEYRFSSRPEIRTQ